MKIFRLLVFLVLTVCLTIALNRSWNQIPALGKFLSPFEGYLQNAETEALAFPDKAVDGLESPVKVYFDEILIPHIYATSTHDLYFTQGYLTARDRLWQMDFYSRLVTGRLSEVLGERALEFDRLNLRIGLKKMTEDLYEVIKKDPELLQIVQAYSEGVNAYLNDLKPKDYPIEFKLLNYTPEEWTPLKSCLAFAMLSNTLSRSEADLENTNARQIFGAELYDILFPEQRGNLDPVIRKGKKWDFKAETESLLASQSYPITKNTISKPNPLYGSNNFVVSGSKTKNGFVLFANEPDLQLTQPSIWHATHLHSPKMNAMGVTVPGTPVLLIGFNDSIAWGVTNSPRDQVDWYRITFKDTDRREYWYNNQWFKTEQVVEEIRIKGKRNFYDTILYVHHGPVVYERNFHGENEKNNYAMRWIAHEPGTTLKTMLMLNTARNYDDYKEALTYFNGPPQNFLLGTAAGDIAIWLPGKFPIKKPGQGKFLMDGSALDQEPKAYIPFDHALQDKNPSQGFLSSANQHPVDSLYPYYIYDHHYEYYRNRRINDRLKSLSQIVPKDFMNLQNDNYNYRASESLPWMLAELDTLSFSPREWNYYLTLSEWDFFNEPNLKAPSLYDLWWEILYKQVWDEFDTISATVDKPNNYVTNWILKNKRDLPLIDRLKTDSVETVNTLVKMSFTMTLDSMETWIQQNGDDYAWYKFKNTHINHMLRLKPFSFDQVRIGGGPGIVNAAGATAGPSWRMIVELDPSGAKAWGVYPGSQTGNPGSPYYGSMIEKWSNGDYYELLFGQEIEKSDKVKFTQTLSPAK